MRSAFSKRLQLAREARGFSQTDLARLAKVPPQRISKIENSAQISSPYIFRFAEILNVNAKWLAGEMGTNDSIIDSDSGLHKDSINITTVSRVTVGGTVEAINWAEACEWSEDQKYQIPILMPEGRSIPYNLEKLFGLEVRGDSMDLEYKPGWVIVCISTYDDPHPLEDGHNVIVRRESSQGCETTVKKLRINKLTGKYELHYHSSNPNYHGLVLPLFNLKAPHTLDNVTISIIARVVLHIPTWETTSNQRMKP